VRDQLAGVEWLRRQDFVNPQQIAVYGWSYGGYMALQLLQDAPNTYAAAIAGAPVTRWELYDTHYTERYLGNPCAGPRAIRTVERAQRRAHRRPFADHHGMADDNVVFENTTVLVGALQQRSIPFDLMVYPGATHRVSGEGREVHMWRTIERFLERNVLDRALESGSGPAPRRSLCRIAGGHWRGARLQRSRRAAAARCAPRPPSIPPVAGCEGDGEVAAVAERPCSAGKRASGAERAPCTAAEPPRRARFGGKADEN
jgi:dienelactone hydrolase